MAPGPVLSHTPIIASACVVNVVRGWYAPKEEMGIANLSLAPLKGQGGQKARQRSAGSVEVQISNDS